MAKIIKNKPNYFGRRKPICIPLHGDLQCLASDQRGAGEAAEVTGRGCPGQQCLLRKLLAACFSESRPLPLESPCWTLGITPHGVLQRLWAQPPGVQTATPLPTDTGSGSCWIARGLPFWKRAHESEETSVGLARAASPQARAAPAGPSARGHRLSPSPRAPHPDALGRGGSGSHGLPLRSPQLGLSHDGLCLGGQRSEEVHSFQHSGGTERSGLQGYGAAVQQGCPVSGCSGGRAVPPA